MRLSGRCLAGALVAGALPLCGCAQMLRPPRAGPEAPTVADKAAEARYQEVLSRFTQRAEIYQGLDTRMFIAATLQAMAFRQARVERVADLRSLPRAEVEAALAKEKKEHGEVLEVFLGVHANERRLDDLARPGSIWRVALVSEAGEVVPVSAVPLMPVIGNHEARADAYFAQLPTPAHPHAEGYHDQEYYSFDYASMHVVALSTEASAAGAQRDWLRADLAAAAARPGIRWTVAFGHRPPFSSGRHGSWLQAYEAWAPVFDEFRVPLTFWGHDHDYERTVPLRGGMAGGKGTVYVVTGGGGAPLGEVGASGFTAFSKTTYEFLEVEVGPDELSVTARDALGEAFDSFKVAHPSLAARREQQRPETIGREPTWPKAAALVGASALFAVVLLLTRRRTG